MVHDVNYSVCSHREQKYGEDEKLYSLGKIGDGVTFLPEMQLTQNKN